MGSLSGSSMDVSCLVVVAIGRSLFGIFLLKLREQDIVMARVDQEKAQIIEDFDRKNLLIQEL